MTALLQHRFQVGNNESCFPLSREHQEVYSLRASGKPQAATTCLSPAVLSNWYSIHSLASFQTRHRRIKNTVSMAKDYMRTPGAGPDISHLPTPVSVHVARSHLRLLRHSCVHMSTLVQLHTNCTNYYSCRLRAQDYKYASSPVFSSFRLFPPTFPRSSPPAAIQYT